MYNINDTTNGAFVSSKKANSTIPTVREMRRNFTVYISFCAYRSFSAFFFCFLMTNENKLNGQFIIWYLKLTYSSRHRPFILMTGAN